jgi:S1-C subfamily serine protease
VILIASGTFAVSGSAQEMLNGSQPGGGTLVPIASELTSLLNQGGVPDSLEALRQLEGQQRRVAAAATACTVSVQIGAAQGCGVIVTESGFVLTAAHVAMRPKQRAKVTLSDGRIVNATTLGMNRNVDAGLIKIDAGQNGGNPWPHASLGSSRDLVAGMWCVATGHPGGYSHQRGTVTRVGRILSVRPGAIVTDCALIGGDSGGPLFDISGRLIAVHSRIGNDVADNLHVPIDNYDFSWKRLYNGEAWGFLPGFRPVLGVRGSSDGPARIILVAEGSPAEKAGVQVDDVIERFNDLNIGTFAELKEAVDDTMPGERVNLVLKRGDDRYRLSVEIGRAD